jgi:DNA-binding transcriptional regulator GbsR (MarR family)
MSKYVSRVIDEVYETFDNHFDEEYDEQIWFLEELIKKLQDELENIQDINEKLTND